MRHNIAVIDSTHGLIHSPHLTTQVGKTAGGTSAKSQVVLTHDNITVQTITTNTIRAFVDHRSEWNTTGTVTPMGQFTKAASLLKSHSMSTIFDKKQQSKSPKQRNRVFQSGKTHEMPSFVQSFRSNPSSSSRWTGQSSVWFRKVIRIWLLTRPSYSKQTNQNSRTKVFGSRHLKIKAKLRITNQSRHDSSKNWMNWMRRKNLTPQTTLNQEG